ncbi:lipase family protein [Nocardia salmonicida]|uniref:lipase family protein n=1 Tax=Nocardia salmonicida TaxID=53431 RepID=UPI002E28C9D8|nr:lipase family protein [Nocardia salmonicida]
MCKCSAVLTGAVGAGLVSALPTAEVAVGDFYSTPMPLPDVAAGAIIRTEPAHLALSVPGQPEMIPASATRIMYRSNDTHDEPTAVVGSYLDPAAPWTGPGERPLVEFDVPALYALLARGMAVVMTGYQGLGTPAVDDFLNRKSHGYAVLDAARAASALPGNGIGAGAPVRLNGYSQGGSATGAAAELRLGNQAPAVPVLVASSRNDDVPPCGTVRSTVEQWCAAGATVELDADLQMPAIAGTAPDHVVSFFPGWKGRSDG